MHCVNPDNHPAASFDPVAVDVDILRQHPGRHGAGGHKRSASFST